MTKFLLKCFFVTTILFLGVLVGIQMASDNLVKMTNDNSYSTANLVEPSQDLKIESFSNNNSNINFEKPDKLTSHDLSAKQEKLKQIKTFNLFSQVGMKLADVFDKLFSSILAKITTAIESALT